MSEVTRILDRVEHGDSKAANELLPLVYDELRRLAARQGCIKLSRQAVGLVGVEFFGVKFQGVTGLVMRRMR